MSELPSYTEMAAEKLKERSKASGGELRGPCVLFLWQPRKEAGTFFFGVALLFALQNVVVHQVKVSKDPWMCFLNLGLCHFISSS